MEPLVYSSSPAIHPNCSRQVEYRLQLAILRMHKQLIDSCTWKSLPDVWELTEKTTHQLQAPNKAKAKSEPRSEQSGIDRPRWSMLCHYLCGKHSPPSAG
jgi:hypothetical protein